MSHDLTNFPAQPQLGLDIADILLTKGWVERVDGGLRLLNEATFWSSLSAVIRDLATVGCFPSQAWFRQVVMHGRASGDPATWFEVRDYRVRTPTLLDLPALLRLEEECWIEPLRASEAALRQRLENNPLGHLVAELHGQTAGVIYSQRIVDVDALFLTDFRAAAALHRQGGPIVQPLAVNVLPAMQHYGIGDQLLEFLLQLVTLQPDVDRVVAVTLCKLYKQHQDRPMEEYIHLRNEQGQLIDPILNFHASHGAKIRAVISGYRPADQDNQGKGVLVEYDGADADAARGAAMQIAAMRPQYLNRDEVPADIVERERSIAEATAKEEGKPEQAIAKITEGRLNGFFKEVALLDQPSVTDNKKSVKQVLDEAGVEIKRFACFEVGA